MSAHTPGPWHLYIARDVSVHDLSGGGMYIAHIINYDIAPEHKNRARDEANARLIAAAPALLEALEAMREHHTAVCGRRCAADEMARAAIRAAKGGA